jgi:hypothetical protein
MGLLRTCIRRQCRLHRSRKFRHQHSGWNGVRLQAAVGAPVVESDGYPRPVPLREARDRYGLHTPTKLPARVRTKAELRAMDRGGAGRGGYRPRGIPGSRAGVLPALPHPAAACGVGHGSLGVPDPGNRALRFSPAGAGDHGICLRDLGLLRDRDCPREASLGTGRSLRGNPASDLGQRLHRGRHAGRNRHAARSVLAFRAGAGTAEGGQFQLPDGTIHKKSCGTRTTNSSTCWRP